ncbi:oligoribonuclease [candidate division WWE3 bacterium]|nr:oligoribonuclease [candidate division WWE3 bacterium]MBT7349264.1 oligoribonuclease [candidate division WWE3 bacterium]
MKNDKNTNLVWIDLEMTGLDLEDNRITEIACLVTNEDLEVIAEGPEIIIKQDVELFDKDDEFLVETFIKSGFADKMQASEYDEEKAEHEVIEFLKKYVEENSSPMCGNSIYMDRMFVNRYMKKLDGYLHYRLIDVTTLKNLATRWYPNLPKYKKSEIHRAMDDIKESIEELKYYRKHLLK